MTSSPPTPTPAPAARLPTRRRFAGRVALVTGGARGMGEEHVRGFADEGASVVIADVAHEDGAQLAAELGDRVLFVPLDVRDESAWERAVDAAEAAFGPIGVLVNNAGITEGPLQTIEEVDPDLWRNVIDVNLVGSYLGIRAVTASMRRAGGGSIVNMSSVRGLSAGRGRSAYASSKWALRGLTKAAAIELGPDGIRVNSVHPGMIRTPLHKTAPERYSRLSIPRVGEPSEVTSMVLFVSSDEASYATGSEFVVDGGFLLGDL